MNKLTSLLFLASLASFNSIAQTPTLQVPVEIISNTTTTPLKLRNNGSPAVIEFSSPQSDAVKGKEPFASYFHTIDWSHMNEDGQRDLVYQFGYNNRFGSGGRGNKYEAALLHSFESHYIPYPGAAPQFEYHIASIAKNGYTNRHLSLNIQKNTGYTTAYWQADFMQLFPTGKPIETAYFAVGDKGVVTATGEAAALRLNRPGYNSFYITLDGSDIRMENYGGAQSNISFLTPGSVLFNSGASFTKSVNDYMGVLVQNTNTGNNAASYFAVKTSSDYLSIEKRSLADGNMTYGTTMSNAGTITTGTGKLIVGTQGAAELRLVTNSKTGMVMDANQGVTFNGNLKIVNSPIPVSNPESGGVMYVEKGSLKYRSAGGRITVIANN